MRSYEKSLHKGITFRTHFNPDVRLYVQKVFPIVVHQYVFFYLVMAEFGMDESLVEIQKEQLGEALLFEFEIDFLLLWYLWNLFNFLYHAYSLNYPQSCFFVF